MIPIALITLGLQTALEALRAWNNLEPTTRNTIITRWLEDDAARRAWWGKFTSQVTELFGKIEL